MKQKYHLKEKTSHGTPLLPIAIHHLSYAKDLDHFFYLHWHDEFEFIVILEGGVLYTLDDTAFSLSQGEGLFVPANTLHAAKALNGLPLEALVVVFHPSLLDEHQGSGIYGHYVHPFLSGDLAFHPHLTPINAWQQQVLSLLAELDQQLSLNHPLLVKSRICEIWHHCYQNAEATHPLTREKTDYKLSRLQPVLDYIHTYYNESLSLQALSSQLPMSDGQFCRTFKTTLGISPIAYVMRYRILKSCDYLAQTDLSISQIAKQVGFNNISYFNRAFLNAIGCSPSQYRKA